MREQPQSGRNARCGGHPRGPVQPGHGGAGLTAEEWNWVRQHLTTRHEVLAWKARCKCTDPAAEAELEAQRETRRQEQAQRSRDYYLARTRELAELAGDRHE